MDQLRTLLSRIAALFSRQGLDADLEEELSTHIDLATAENMTLGMSRQQARTKALREFGGLTQATETYRTRRGFPLLDQVGRDLRFGLRQLFRSPGFALTAILTLALGLGANTAIFSLVNALLLRPLPVPHAEQLAILSANLSGINQPIYGLTAPEFRALEKNHAAFQSVAAFFNTKAQVHGATGNQQASIQLVSGRYFETLEVPPLLGRYLTPADDAMSGNPAGYAAVISEGFWRTWFNRAPNVVGNALVLANTPFTVVGVMPDSFFGADPTSNPNIFVPLSAEPIVDAPYNMIASGAHANWLNLIARRKPDLSLEQANTSLQAVSNAILEESYPDASQVKDFREQRFHLAAEPGSKGFTYLRFTFRKPLEVVFALCGGVLLLACLNLASLLLARASARQRELATRLAIGASRRRLIQQLLIESLLIASFGAMAGLAVSPIVSRSLAALLLSGVRDTNLDTSLDFRVFLFAALVTVATTILIGLIPAIRATSRELIDQIKIGSLARSSRDRRILLPRLVMGAQVALALMLVIGAGLLAASLSRLYRTGLGFDPKGIVHLDLVMGKQPLADDALIRWYRQFGDALAHQPQVESVSFESVVPLSGSTVTDDYHSPLSHGDQQLYVNLVAPSYFATMHIPMLLGRDFRWDDSNASGQKIILNRSAAKTLFPGRDALGQTLYGYDKNQYQVIAVVGDVHYLSIRESAPPAAYRPITQWTVGNAEAAPSAPRKPSYSAVVRIAGPAASFAAAARTLASRVGTDIPAPAMTSMVTQLNDSISSERMMATLAVFFAACALLVTAIGLYGTLAYATARRTSEIGIRMALGAQRTQVIALVFRENAWVAAFGCFAGLSAALFASRLLASFLYGTSAHDPWVLAASVTALLAIASAASLLPAIRAARIEPMQALRAE